MQTSTLTMTSELPAPSLTATGRKRLWAYTLCLAAVVIALLPLWLLPKDTGEGVKVDFAMTTNLFLGEHARLFELRWPLEFYLLVGLKHISLLLHIPPRILLHLTATAAVVGIAAEVRLYAMRVLRMPASYALLAALLALVFPAWPTLANSDYLMRAVCVWLLLIGYRLFCHPRPLPRLAGLALMVLSFQNYYNCVLVGVLAVADGAMELLYTNSLSVRTLYRTVGLIALPALLFAVLFNLVKPYGMYAHYLPAGLYVYVLCPPASLALASICWKLGMALRGRRYLTWLGFLIPAVMGAGFTSGLYRNYGMIAERESFEMGLVASLRKNPDAEPTAGLVYLYYDGLNDLQLEPYEMNWIMWRAYRKFPWFTEIGNTELGDQGIDIPKNVQDIIDSNNLPHAIAQLIPRHLNIHCQTFLRVEGSRYDTPMAWKWLLRMAPPPLLNTQQAVMRCG